MNNGYVVVIGGANIDIGGTPYNKLIEDDSNPGRITVSFGGVGRNIAHNLSKLGVNVKLITAAGRDFLGKELLDHCNKSGIDTSYSVQADGIRSSMYMYINDDKGDMQLAVSDMDICSLITPEYIDDHIDIINNSAAVVADCNLTEQSLDHLRKVCTSPLFIDPVSINKAYKIKNNMKGIYAVKPNMIEAGYLTDINIRSHADCAAAAAKLIEQGTEKVFISMDADGILAADINNIYITENYEADLVNTTGAGDSSTAAAVWAYLLDNNKDDYLIKASKAANAAAAMTISVNESINKEMNSDSILNIMNKFSTNIIKLK